MALAVSVSSPPPAAEGVADGQDLDALQQRLGDGPRLGRFAVVRLDDDDDVDVVQRMDEAGHGLLGLDGDGDRALSGGDDGVEADTGFAAGQPLGADDLGGEDALLRCPADALIDRGEDDIGRHHLRRQRPDGDVAFLDGQPHVEIAGRDHDIHGLAGLACLLDLVLGALEHFHYEHGREDRSDQRDTEEEIGLPPATGLLTLLHEGLPVEAEVYDFRRYRGLALGCEALDDGLK